MFELVCRALGVVGLLLALCLPANASENLYFYVAKSGTSCFMDEVMQTATLLVRYRHDEYASKPLRISLSLKGKPVKSEVITAKEGKFAYAALETGMYRLCIEPDDKFPQLGFTKFFLRTQVLANSIKDDISDDKLPPIAKSKQVVTLQQELDKVTETVELLLRKLQMARDRETHFRDQSERINERVVWWSIAQTLFLIVAGSFQSVHLHNFFLQKKIA